LALPRLLVEPETVRAISLVRIAGRRFSPAVATFVAACRTYAWPGGTVRGATEAPTAYPRRNVNNAVTPAGGP
jgi:hypothetical protein